MPETKEQSIVKVDKTLTSRRWFLDLTQGLEEVIKVRTDEAHALISECHFDVGRMILDASEHYTAQGMSETHFCQMIAETLHRPFRNFYYGVQFARGNKSFEKACSDWKVSVNTPWSVVCKVIDGNPIPALYDPSARFHTILFLSRFSASIYTSII